MLQASPLNVYQYIFYLPGSELFSFRVLRLELGEALGVQLLLQGGLSLLRVCQQKHKKGRKKTRKFVVTFTHLGDFKRNFGNENGPLQRQRLLRYWGAVS